MRRIFPALLLALLAGCEKPVEAEPEPAPAPAAAQASLLPADGASLYELDIALTDQDGKATSLRAFEGRALVVTMFYASCPVACPMLISDVKNATRGMTVDVLLVSLDPERDTTPRLKELARQHRVDEKHWHFTRTTDASTRELAAVLGIKYKKLGTGAIRHTSLISVLDPRGVVRFRAMSPVPAEDTSLPLAIDALRDRGAT